MTVRIRKLEHDMITIGTGIIIFGFWSFIKFALTNIFLGMRRYESVDGRYTALVTAVIWGVAALAPLIYLWIGMSARAEGKGRRRSILNLIMLAIIILLSTIVILAEIFALISLKNVIEMAFTLIIDLTRLVFLLELFADSITLRVLRKQQRIGEGCEE